VLAGDVVDDEAAGVVGDEAAGVVGDVAGGAIVSELPEPLFALEDLADRLGELDEPEPWETPLATPSYDKPDDAPVSEETLDDFTVACVDPGRRATTAPATATLAKDAVTVVAFSRRLPCSRSATACATRRAAAWPSARGVLAWSRGVFSPSSQLFMPISLTWVGVSAVRRRSQNALSSCSMLCLPGRDGTGGLCLEARVCDHCPMGNDASAAAFRAARDLLLRHREDYGAARLIADAG